MRAILAVLLASGLLAPGARAEVTLPAVFGDGMVLQRGRPVPVWGRAKPGARLQVAFANQVKSTRADARGRWRADLDAMDAGGPYTLVVTGDGEARCHGVLVGEVWVCSGQSNMAFRLAGARNAQEEIAGSSDWDLRLFQVAVHPLDEAGEDVQGCWTPCSPRTVPQFSAVAYFFGRALRRALGVPVGLLHTSVGGTPAEAWMDRDRLRHVRGLAPLAERWRKAVHRADATPARDKLRRSPQRPGTLWNGMVAPLVPYAMRGVIWYQGESNAARAEQYATLFPALIGDWREQWGQGDFPFLFVQLANFRARRDAPGESVWAELREAQRLTLGVVPATGMAVTIDIGDAKNIHPKDKQDVGARLAAWALSKVYGRDVVPSGPLFRAATRQGRALVLEFDHAQGLHSRDGGPLQGFAVADRPLHWVWARAHVRDDTVVVEVPAGTRARYVRYAWADNPACNLVNAAGLPASPFRTDDFPLVTAGKQ